MPLPIVAGAAVFKLSAALIGGAAFGAGGTAIYKDSKHKKELARLQDRINELQRKLDMSYQREKELINRIQKLQQEKHTLLEEITIKQIEINRIEIEQKGILTKIKRNDTRFRQIIAKLIFREKQLLNKVEELQTKLISTELSLSNGKKDLLRNKSRITHIENYRNIAEEELVDTQSSVKKLQNDITDLEGHLNE